MTPEIRGLFASLGIEKGKPFKPDDRMKAILADGVAMAEDLLASGQAQEKMKSFVDFTQLMRGDGS